MKHFISLALCFGPIALLAQSLTFNRTYETARYDDTRGIVATADGGFAFTGLCKAAEDSLGDMYLTKVNAAGAILWKKYYGREKEDGGNSLLATADGGYLITGHTALSYGEECDGYLVKTDANGQEQWRSLVGTALDDVCNNSLQLADGSFLTTGRIENPDTRTFRVMLAKINPVGETVFLKELQTTLPAIGFKIIQSNDGNLLIAGYAYRAGQQNSEMLVLKCTPDGAVLWETNWGTEINDRAYALVPLPDGSIVAVGGSSDAADRLVNMLALRLDAHGNILATNTTLAVPGNGYLYDMLLTPNGQIAVAGIVSDGLDTKGSPAMAFLDFDLHVTGWRLANFARSCRTRCLAQDRAGNFLLGGYVQDRNAYGIFLAKMSENKMEPGTDVDAMPFLLFPNPFSGITYLKIGEPFRPKKLTISTMEGKVLRSIHFDATEIFIQRDGLAAGNYFFSVQDNQANCWLPANCQYNRHNFYITILRYSFAQRRLASAHLRP